MKRRMWTSAAAVVLVGLGGTRQAGATEAGEVSEVIVTGTREAKTPFESSAPVDVLTAEALSHSGRTSVRDLIATLSASTDVTNSGAGASLAVKTLSLRGLAGDQTLVLVNGKRRHASAILHVNGTTQNGQTPVDLDLLPGSAVGRIEILRDGASAQYGSDAIGGVVNVIFDPTPDGLSAEVEAGRRYLNDGAVFHAQGSRGFALGEDGRLRLSAELRHQGRAIRTGPNPTRIYPLVNGAPDPREATADRFSQRNGQPRVESYALGYDGGIVQGTIEVYSFGTLSGREASGYLTHHNPGDSTNNLQVYPDGFTPLLVIRNLDYAATLGAKGRLGPVVMWDLSTTYGRDRARYRHDTDLNPSLGPQSPTTFRLGHLRSDEWTTNLDLIAHPNVVPGAAPLNAAVGLEYRSNRYAISPGEPASYIDGGFRHATGPYAGMTLIAGALGVAGFRPQDAGAHRRDNWSAYVDLEQPVTDAWSVSGALRYEDYSDFGDHLSWKVATRFELNGNLALRANVNTGFRAPSLAQQYYSAASTRAVVLPGQTAAVLFPLQALPVGSAAARALGASPLEPERSRNLSAGLAWRSTDGAWSGALDAYQIRIEDRILLTGNLIGTAVSAALAKAGLNPNQGGFYFANAATTTTRGIELSTSYDQELGSWGRIVWSLSADLRETEIDSLAATPPQLAAAGLVLFDRVRQLDIRRGTPRSKVVASANWTRGDWGSSLRLTRYGPVTYPSALGPARDERNPSALLTDFEVSYEMSTSLTATVGADNLFNVYPAKNKVENSANAFYYYNQYSPYQGVGGFYYVRVALKL